MPMQDRSFLEDTVQINFQLVGFLFVCFAPPPLELNTSLNENTFYKGILLTHA